MSHKINLEKYQIRTDLAIDRIPNYDEEDYDGIKVSHIKLNDEDGKKINKKKGHYITISFDDITDSDAFEKVKKVFASSLRDLLSILNIGEEKKCLVIGLGNDKSTPDALGPKTVENILVTSHLFKLSEVDDGYRLVSAFIPGVMGTTGLEASDVIKGITKMEKFDFLIVIDALASSSIDRVNKTIQISTSGINPGSGIGNNRKEISYESLKIPVIAIGVPTVVDAATISFDTINYMYKHFAYVKERISSPSSKLAFGSSNYLKTPIVVDDSDKKNLFGLIGDLTDEEVIKLLDEVLTPTGYNLMVTPKEVDFIIEKLGSLLGNGINMALHKKLYS